MSEQLQATKLSSLSILKDSVQKSKEALAKLVEKQQEDTLIDKMVAEGTVDIRKLKTCDDMN